METILLEKDDSLLSALILPRGVTAIVGGGGKTTLMLRLARELGALGARVIVTTTTHIFPPEGMPTLTNATLQDAQTALEQDRVICLGNPSKDGKLSAPDFSIDQMQQIADYVLVEADGAKRLPLKAPAAHEPVIPPETRLVVAVAGLDGLGKSIQESTFRPELYAALCEKTIEDVITTQDMAAVLTHTNGQRKGVADGMRFAVLLNKADDASARSAARNIATYLQQSNTERVVIASLGGTAAGLI